MCFDKDWQAEMHNSQENKTDLRVISRGLKVLQVQCCCFRIRVHLILFITAASAAAAHGAEGPYGKRRASAALRQGSAPAPVLQCQIETLQGHKDCTNHNHAISSAQWIGEEVKPETSIKFSAKATGAPAGKKKKKTHNPPLRLHDPQLELQFAFKAVPRWRKRGMLTHSHGWVKTRYVSNKVKSRTIYVAATNRKWLSSNWALLSVPADANTNKTFLHS